MEFLVKDLASSIKSTEQELRSALSKLGFQIVSKRRQNVVSGAVKHTLLSDGAEITADKATKELAAIALEYSKTIIEIATFIVEYKPDSNGNKTIQKLLCRLLVLPVSVKRQTYFCCLWS
ncbi:MAG: hypothetical protein WBB28_06480 [Crinalium sp.]